MSKKSKRSYVLTSTKIGSTPNTTFNTSLSNGTSATFVVKSAYTIFKNNASTGSEITVKISPSIPGGDGDDNDNDNDNVDDENQDKDDDSDNPRSARYLYDNIQSFSYYQE